MSDECEHDWGLSGDLPDVSYPKEITLPMECVKCGKPGLTIYEESEIITLQEYWKRKGIRN